MPLPALPVWRLAELCRCLLDQVLSLLAAVVSLLAELLLALRVWLLAELCRAAAPTARCVAAC
jgi:hypothetical protein